MDEDIHQPVDLRLEGEFFGSFLGSEGLRCLTSAGCTETCDQSKLPGSILNAVHLGATERALYFVIQHHNMHCP